MGKRTSEGQITKDDYERDALDDLGSGELTGSFKKASAEQLKRRRIVRSSYSYTPAPADDPARSSGGLASSVPVDAKAHTPEQANPFARVRLQTPSNNAPTFSIGSTVTFATQSKNNNNNKRKASELAMDLNKAFVDRIRGESKKNLSSCWTPMIDKYLKYAKRIKLEHYSSAKKQDSSTSGSGADVSSTSKGASVNPFTFGITGAKDASSSTTSSSLPPFSFGGVSTTSGVSSAPVFSTGGSASLATSSAAKTEYRFPKVTAISAPANAPEQEEDEGKEEEDDTMSIGKNKASDYEDRFALDKVVVYKMRPVLDKKQNEIVDAEGKPKMAFQNVATLMLRLQENKMTGTVVLNLWDDLNPKMSLTLTKGMEFTVISQKTRKGRTVRMVSFLGLVDANRVNEKNTLESTRIRCSSEDRLDELLKELERIGCVIRRI